MSELFPKNLKMRVQFMDGSTFTGYVTRAHGIVSVYATCYRVLHPNRGLGYTAVPPDPKSWYLKQHNLLVSSSIPASLQPYKLTPVENLYFAAYTTDRDGSPDGDWWHGIRVPFNPLSWSDA
jgi:hypothetical protein